MSHEIHPENHESQFFEIELTPDQYENIISRLPRGFTLEQAFDAPRLTPHSSKKHSIHVNILFLAFFLPYFPK